MDRGAWWAKVHGFSKSQTQLNDKHLHFQSLISLIFTHFRTFTVWQHTELWLQCSVSFKNYLCKEGCITLLDNMPDREGDEALVNFYCYLNISNTSIYLSEALPVLVTYTDTYIWNLEKWYLWTYFQNRNRDPDSEDELVDTMGDGQGEMNWGNSTDINTRPHEE